MEGGGEGGLDEFKGLREGSDVPSRDKAFVLVSLHVEYYTVDPKVRYYRGTHLIP